MKINPINKNQIIFSDDFLQFKNEINAVLESHDLTPDAHVMVSSYPSNSKET